MSKRKSTAAIERIYTPQPDACTRAIKLLITNGATQWSYQPQSWGRQSRDPSTRWRIE